MTIPDSYLYQDLGKKGHTCLGLQTCPLCLTPTLPAVMMSSPSMNNYPTMLWDNGLYAVIFIYILNKC